MLTFQEALAQVLVDARADTIPEDQVEAALPAAREEAVRVMSLLYLRGLAIGPAVNTATLMRSCEAFLAARGTPMEPGEDPPQWVMRGVWAVLEAIYDRGVYRDE